ncbi:CaiB/BaiF CoA transferase family protein [Saccharospirillum impatiens]|uniref:CaiB/BaiF CoA transferase family protein n=1 Tax=Saccharospirillum impatiens TaxID=169438 RepID=UPI000408F012|nr:CaiB/BaiF CoA-transferase family protein [Saccharospirillum impatiens]
MTDAAVQGALSGIRVIDLSRILAGPWATQMLADFGAEVIKVERPGQGDDTRGWGPPFLGEGAHRVAAYFHSANRGKQSIAIDFTQPEGQQLLRDLIRDADVLVENYKVDGLKKYGLDYDSLKSINPRLVYCSITGFGQTGPYRQRAGYDFMIQGMSGLMSVTGEPDGSPMKAGVALSDILTGLYAANAIQAALHFRASTGLGQHIDLSLLDVQVAAMANQAMNYLATGHSPGRLGNAHPNIVPYQAFATADDYLILAVGNDGQFQRFCDVAGCPDLALDERFATNQARVAHREDLLPIIIDRMKTQSRDWWLTQLEAVSVPCGPINTLEQVFADPQVQSRELQRELDQPELGKVPSVANPIRFSESVVQYDKAAPSLGADTDRVLTGLLKCDAEQLKQWRQQGIVG